jgi:hypothetical protein
MNNSNTSWTLDFNEDRVISYILVDVFGLEATFKQSIKLQATSNNLKTNDQVMCCVTRPIINLKSRTIKFHFPLNLYYVLKLSLCLFRIQIKIRTLISNKFNHNPCQ